MRCLLCKRDGLSLDTQTCPNPGCGVHLPSLLRLVLPPGTKLRGGDYCIDYALGQGGFGITYRARHTRLDELCAIKEYFPQSHAVRDLESRRLTVPAHFVEGHRRGLDKFEREGRLLRKLDHPGIVRVQDLFEENGTAYLVMELVDGHTLRDELDAQPNGRLPPDRVASIVDDLVSALAVLHERHIHHLDIKPDNVMLAGERIVLVDFGAARQGLGTATSHVYTESYAPVELVAEDTARIGPATDLFELGMMIHELLTGTLPPRAVLRLTTDTWRPDHLAEPWRTLLEAALRVRADDRPASVGGWWKSSSSSACRRRAPSVFRRPRRRTTADEGRVSAPPARGKPPRPQGRAALRPLPQQSLDLSADPTQEISMLWGPLGVVVAFLCTIVIMVSLSNCS